MKHFRDFDLKAELIPEDVVLKKDSVIVNEGMKMISNASVFFRETLPQRDCSSSSAISVLLLHGQRFSSKTWLDLGTLQLLALMGYRTIAIDLPGYGNTPPIILSDHVSFLQDVIDGFNLKELVIVSPSMSGFFSLPYLIKHHSNLKGYVPVAPVGYEVLEALPVTKDLHVKDKIYAPLREYLLDPIPNLEFIKTPTMIVFGELDRTRSSALLNLLPESQCQEIPNGRHPAYLDNPSLWHQLLYNFLKQLRNHNHHKYDSNELSNAIQT